MDSRVTALETLLPTLATKVDVAELRADMKVAVAELRADLHKADSEHKTWILATVLSVLGTGVAVVTFLRNVPPVQAPAPQPSIIIVPGTALTAPAAPEAPPRR